MSTVDRARQRDFTSNVKHGEHSHIKSALSVQVGISFTKRQPMRKKTQIKNNVTSILLYTT